MAVMPIMVVSSQGTAPVNVQALPYWPGMIVYDGSMNGVMRQ